MLKAVMTSRFFDVYPILSYVPTRPPSSAGMGEGSNRVAGLAMHPVDQREGVDDRRGGRHSTVAAAATVLPPTLLLFLPLPLLILH